jgi:hypothetical protein
MAQDTNTAKRFPWLALAALAALVVVGLIIWRTDALRNGARPAAGRPASAEIAANFFTSLAALDVEENELAATLLAKSTEAEPGEPALWANLAIAQLRLRETEKARATFERATELAGDVPEVMLLHAEILEQAGDVEAAIEKLRQVHTIQPQNDAAAYTLASLLGRIRTPAADAERLALLAGVLDRSPANLRARCEQARLAATLEQAETLRQALDALSGAAPAWPEPARVQLTRAGEAAAAGRFREAATALTIFENLIKPLTAYQQSVAELGAADTAIGTPLRRLLRLTLAAVEAAAADREISFTWQPLPENAARPDLLLALPAEGSRRAILMTLANSQLQVGEAAALPFPGPSTDASPSSVLAADLNDDLRLDLVLAGPGGCRIFLQQEDGAFAAQETSLPEFNRPWRSVWALDMEADGDLDLVLSDHQSPLACVRNNGDMTFAAVDNLPAATSVVAFETIDIDQDCDVDVATLGATGQLSVWLNDRGGRYSAAQPPTRKSILVMAAGDVDRDGRFDLVTLSKTGEVEHLIFDDDGAWNAAAIASWPSLPPADDMRSGRANLQIADLDNNGAVDVIASLPHQTSVWLAGEPGNWSLLASTPPMFVSSIVDLNDDGLLDLVGLTEVAGGSAANGSRAGYSWLFVDPRASAGAGDKRINSFAIDGRIEVRAGYLVQAAMIRSPRVHFGLGRYERANVIGIVWPNCTFQAEFDFPSKAVSVAQQRLKGSCPWVFAFDGREFHFVKDFIWRSPLGMRINAQDTAPATQTEDWIKVSGRQLAALDGRYLLRITAELWETHFFDHVSLVAVDHPADVEVFVDERFVATKSQDHTIVVVTPPRPVVNPIDHRGRPLQDELQSVDGTYADRFALGAYQGAAEDHWVEFELPDDIDPARQVLVVAHGWVYPTDSSLNVAISQGRAGPPLGLVLEQLDEGGQWRTLRDGLGFPAGKSKDAVIALPAGALAGSRRFRLRTSTETYWDSLGWAYQAAEVQPRLTRIPVATAMLRFRGYSRLVEPTARRRPDIPAYQVEATDQRWLDLEGFYTRFGEVLPLLSKVDDRYVIMNAGDELALEFAAPGEPPPGWQRDFVLIGDGWVKDGDFNTAFSRWVGPLPAHDAPEYAGPLVPLERDPVHLRHPDDWQIYHTRYVAPGRFRRGLWPPFAPSRDNVQQP